MSYYYNGQYVRNKFPRELLKQERNIEARLVDIVVKGHYWATLSTVYVDDAAVRMHAHFVYPTLRGLTFELKPFPYYEPR